MSDETRTVTVESLASALYSSSVLFTEAHADHPSQTDWDDLSPAVQDEWHHDAASIFAALPVDAAEALEEALG